MAESDLARINIKIDKELKDDLKLIALKNNETMTDILIREIKQYIKDNEELLY